MSPEPTSRGRICTPFEAAPRCEGRRRRRTCRNPKRPAPGATARDDPDEPEPAERGWSERRRLAANLDSAVFSGLERERGKHLRYAPEGMSRRVEPDPQRADRDGRREEDAQDAAVEADDRGSSGDEEQDRVGERDPRSPSLAEHLAVL